jgi:signal transduction histidine kinase
MGEQLSGAATGAALALTAAAATVAAGASLSRSVLLLLLAILVGARWRGRAAGYAATLTGAAFCVIRLVASGREAPPDLADGGILLLLGVIGYGIAAWIGPDPGPIDPSIDPSRVKEEFLATVSHELRTPLNAILGWTALLRTRQAVEPQQVDRGLEVIERNARRQLALVEELIAAAEPETSPEHWQSLDVREILVSLHDALEPPATTAGVEVVMDGRPRAEPLPEPLWVRGDGASLRLALRHVLDNAIKYTPAGGKVHTRLRPCGGRILIFVTDTGAGLDADRVEQVFEPFRQGDGTASRRYGGLGLGLTIARKLIERHGGHVDLRSDGPSGSTVLITLPLAAPPPQQDAPPLH